MSFNLYDLVRVKEQPKMQSFVELKGTVAVIMEIQGDYCTIDALTLDGRMSGSGAVELSCLVLEDDPKWLSAHITYMGRFYE